MHSPTDRRGAFYPRGTIEERFWAKVNKQHPNGCWLWTGYIDHNGVGKFSGGPREMQIASRASYILHNGPIPKGLVVRHKCDNPACVNPTHLELGTQRDNIRDMIERERGNWRAPKGEERHNAILTEDQVRYIRSSDERGIDLAERFGVKPTTISAIRVGRLWKHLS